MWIIIIVILLLIYFKNKGIPMFLYHQVNSLSNVTPELFEEHLKILKSKGMNTITLKEYGDGKISKNSFLITLDDGYYDNYSVVFQLLKKYDMKATVFLNTMYIKDRREGRTESLISGEANYQAMENYLKTGDGTTEQYLTWEEIREMYESGLVDFQAHSHKHTAVFVSDKIEGFFNGDERDITELYLYGEIEKGYPKFPKRGEYASRGIIIKKEFFKKFKEYYNRELIEKDEKEKLRLAQVYIDNNKERYFHYENEEEFEERVKRDFYLNKKLIEENLGNKVEYFCWPWGHRNKKIIEILKKEGVKGFVTTKKGTNGKTPNYEMIRRVELRKFTPNKFKLNLFITRNYILGKIYGWIS
jgi:peptidoglycan/xylan/chitin deacetylase (PgdA/CDA1 family)